MTTEQAKSLYALQQAGHLITFKCDTIKLKPLHDEVGEEDLLEVLENENDGRKVPLEPEDLTFVDYTDPDEIFLFVIDEKLKEFKAWAPVELNL